MKAPEIIDEPFSVFDFEVAEEKVERVEDFKVVYNPETVEDSISVKDPEIVGEPLTADVSEAWEDAENNEDPKDIEDPVSDEDPVAVVDLTDDK